MKRVEAMVKPRLRGVSHQYAALAALIAGCALVLAAPTGRARLACGVYGLALVAMFTTSALYHRVGWRAAARRWMQRLDHSMIFVLIAGTYTPFALLALHGRLAGVLLAVSWGGALAGVTISLVWVDAPRALSALLYVTLGWVSLVGVPQIVQHAGATAVALLATGGLLYTAGAVIYARRRPDPAPAVFGYHEVFHAFVIAAAVAQFAAVVGLLGLASTSA